MRLSLTLTLPISPSVSNPFGRLPDKAIDLVDEACANVRVALDSQPEEIDALERKRIQLEVELHALEKEKDKPSAVRAGTARPCPA